MSPMMKVEVDFSRPQSVVGALRLLRARAAMWRLRVEDGDEELYRDLATILQAAADTAQDAVTLDAARI